MRIHSLLAMSLCLATGIAGGCAVWLPSQLDSNKSHSPLRPVKPSPDSLAVDVFIARLPADDGLCDSLWQRIDEQQILHTVRSKLARNGFRAGIVSGMVPDELARVLRIKEAEIPDPDAAASTKESIADPVPSTPANLVDLADDCCVTRQWLRLRAGQKTEIHVSDIYPTLPVLINDEDGLHGQTFQQAQAVYAIRATLEPQQQATIEVIPELQHGQTKTRYAAGDGPYWRLDISRDREVFEQLRIPATLQPGQMLVLGCDIASQGSLGHHFHHVQEAKGAGHRLVVIRLAQVPDEIPIDLPDLPAAESER
ncbi:MAG: hypothetical protein JW829_14710 [Pirellulales bacterium]|nr:hypothetical protein [Pirellulales bacterium]